MVPGVPPGSSEYPWIYLGVLRAWEHPTLRTWMDYASGEVMRKHLGDLGYLVTLSKEYFQHTHPNTLSRSELS